MKKGIILSVLALSLIGCSNKNNESISNSSIGADDVVSIEARAINPDIKYLSAFDENNIEVKVTKGSGDVEYIPVSELVIDDSDFNSTDSSNKTAVTIFAEKYKYSQEIEFNIVPRDDFKVLFVGNSFSHNIITFMKPIANNLGITSEIGNLNIGGASINDHLGFIGATNKPYTYEYVEDNGTITINKPVNGSYGLNDKKWDFISFQQNSQFVGISDSYDDTVNLIASTFSQMEDNESARALWHMTWAFQSDYRDSRFEYYHNDQMEMYNCILDAVNTWVVDNPFISGIIPSATAVQNARTSFVGDHLTVDGYHLNEGLGCYIVSLLAVKSLTNCDLSKLTYKPSSVNELQMQMAIEAVENAFDNPFEITDSSYTEGPTYDDISKDPNYRLAKINWIHGNYYDRMSNSGINLRNDPAADGKFICTPIFTKEYLPIGSVIVVDPTYKIRRNSWEEVNSKYDTREAFYSNPRYEVDEEFWGSYNYISWNISKSTTSLFPSYESAYEAFKIYVPVGTKDMPGGIDDINFDDYDVYSFNWIDGNYYDRVSNSGTNVRNDPAAKNKFACTPVFTKDDLPNGSIITFKPGYHVRRNMWETPTSQYTTREAFFTGTFLIVDASFWDVYSLVSWNVSRSDTSAVSSYNELHEVITIYILQ